MLCENRIRLVALSNIDPVWWPGTSLYDALSQSGHIRMIQLPRWRIYLVHLPDGSA